MRNLKRALSLALASVMVLGLMVVGSSAKGYDDVTSEENVEAIEVLQAVGIMTGDDNGNFNPTQNVTRNEMAVIMSNLMDYRVATYKGTSPFTDVPEWAEPYVAACYTNGIIAGYSATTFGGSDPVVTSQATLMILKALGYFKYSSDFGDDWQLATINQAGRIDLLEGVDSAVRVPMTRNDVAQLVLNGLEAGTVEPDTSNKIDISVGDTQITSGAKYNFVTSGRDYAFAINRKLDTRNDGQYSAGAIVELGEKLYQGDLTKEGINDALGRPATVWEFQTKEIGTYVDAADYEWSKKVTSKTLYTAVGKAATDNYDWEVYVDGVLKYETPAASKGWAGLNSVKTNDDPCFLSKILSLPSGERTGNGALTQVFLSSTMEDNSTLDERDGRSRTVTVTVTHYYAAEVYKVNDSVGTVNLSAYYGPARTSDDFLTDGFEAGDIVMYAYSNEAKSIQDIYDAERMEGEVTRVRSNTVVGEESDGDNFAADGENYSYNMTLLNADRLVTENVGNQMVGYKDAFGYVAYIDESAVTYDYAYVLSMGVDTDRLNNDNRNPTKTGGNAIWARLVLTDGSVVSVQTNLKASDAKNDSGVLTDYNKDGNAANQQTFRDTIAKYRYHIVSYTKDTAGIYSLTVKDTSDTRASSTYTGSLKNQSGTGDYGQAYPLNVLGVANNDPGAGGWIATSNPVISGTVKIANPNDLSIKNNVASIRFNDTTAMGTVGTGHVFTANAKTTFIVAESVDDELDDYSYSVYQGIANVPDIIGESTGKTKIAVAADRFGIAKVVYVQDGEISGLKNVTFIRADPNAKITAEKDNGSWYEVKAWVDGQAEDLKIKVGSNADHALVDQIDANSAALDVGNSRRIVAASNLVVDSNGLVTSLSLFKKYQGNASNFNGVRVYDDRLTDNNNDVIKAVGTDRQTNDVVYFGTSNPLRGRGYSWNDETAFVYYDGDNGDIFQGSNSVSMVHRDDNDRAIIVLDGDVLIGACVWDIPDTTGGGNSGIVVDGQKLGPNSTVNEVNEALKRGNVVITGDWQRRTVVGDDNTLNIPQNRALQINGHFDAQTYGITVNGVDTSSVLVVDRTFTTLDNDNQYNYTIQADQIYINAITRNNHGVSAIQTPGDVKQLSGDITANRIYVNRIRLSTESSTTVLTTTLDVTGKVVLNSTNSSPALFEGVNDGTYNIYNANVRGNGHVDVGGTDRATGTSDGIHWTVTNTNTLIIRGTLANGSLTIGGSSRGHAQVGTIASTAKLVFTGEGGSVVITTSLLASGVYTNALTAGTQSSITFETAAVSTNSLNGTFVESTGAVVPANQVGGHTYVIPGTNTTQSSGETDAVATGGVADTTETTEIPSVTSLLRNVGAQPTAVGGTTADHSSDKTDKGYGAAERKAYIEAMNAWKTKVTDAVKAADQGIYAFDETLSRARNWQNITSYYGSEYGKNYPHYTDGTNIYAHGWDVDNGIDAAGGKDRAAFVFDAPANGYVFAGFYNGTTLVDWTAADVTAGKGWFYDKMTALTDGTTYTWKLVYTATQPWQTTGSGQSATTTVLNNVVDAGTILVSGALIWKGYAGYTQTANPGAPVALTGTVPASIGIQTAYVAAESDTNGAAFEAFKTELKAKTHGVYAFDENYKNWVNGKNLGGTIPSDFSKTISFLYPITGAGSYKLTIMTNDATVYEETYSAAASATLGMFQVNVGTGASNAGTTTNDGMACGTVYGYTITKGAEIVLNGTFTAPGTATP